MITISEPVIGEPEEKLVLEVLRSGRLVKGPMVEQFEDEVGRVAGTRHAIAVNSGTSALIAGLMSNDIGPGDEVITSPFTFVATLNAVLHAGATVRFVDVGDDFIIDPVQVATAIGPRTRAVMPVHLYGCPAAMEPLATAVAGRNIVLVEDAAQALGAQVGGRPAGSFGTGCFSFYATKNVTTGEGGAVTTDDDEVAEAVRMLRDQGQRACYGYGLPGFNLRMTELQAALGVAQMARLPDIVEARRRNAGLLTEGLSGIEGLLLPVEPPGRWHVYHQYTVRVTPAARRTRDELRWLLEANEIGCGVYYPRPVFDYPCFRDDPRIARSPTPMAARLAAEVLSLPVHPKLTAADLDRVIDTLRLALT
jgi:dTDP-4-amino-4,6-dideoxygalactose transaminase